MIVASLGAACSFPATDPRVMAPVRRGPIPGTRPVGTLYRPWGDDTGLRGGLGFMPYPRQVISTVGGPPGWHPGVDAHHLNHYGSGEPTMWSDGSLGYIPGDNALAKISSCYQPVNAGWVSLEQTPLGEEASIPTDVGGLLAGLSRYQKLALVLSATSTLAIVANAVVNIYRTVQAPALRAA